MSSKDAMIGAKGGGSSFRNTPDNLRSTDTFEALIGLCSGRIKGLAPGGLQNLFVDDVPIEDSLGSANLTDFVATLFDGDPAVLQPVQLVLGGSSGANQIGLAVNNPYPQGTPGDWRNGTINQVNADFIDLRFVVNALYRQDKKGIYEATANLEIQFKASGTDTWINPLLPTAAPTYNVNGNLLTGTFFKIFAERNLWNVDGTAWDAGPTPGYLSISGKTTGPFVKELRVAVPNTGAWANRTWAVRVRLIDRDTYTQDENEERRTIIWESIAGVSSAPIGNREEWRGLSYLHVNGKATDQLNGIPTITGIYDLSMCRVPPASVWNPETRVYTGAAWDGATEEIKWTQCPAFQLKDLIEDGVSGLSALVPGSTLNKWDTLDASKWYAQLVPNGKGGYHPRYSMNYMLDSALSVNELIQYVAGATGSYAWDEGDSTWRVLVDKPENATAIFTKENIVGEFVYSHTDIDTRFNDMTGVYRDEERRFQETRVRVFDQQHIDTYGRNHQSVALVGCTNRQEALRRIKLRQLVSVNETRFVNFTTNRQGRMLTPFGVILVADQDLGLASSRTTGRLVYNNGTTVLVRDKVRLEVGVNYKLHITVPNPDYNPDITTQPTNANWRKPMVTITRNILNTASQRGDVTKLVLDSALPVGTPENAPIAFEAVNLPTMPKQYRILSVDPQDDGELVAISAVEIYTPKWDLSDAVNEGEVLAQTSNRTPPPPTGLAFRLDTFPSEFQTKRVINVSWKRPDTYWFNGYKIEYKFNDGPAILLTDKTQDQFVELQEVQDGVYEFFVYTLDKRGTISQPLVGSYTLGEAPPPGSSQVTVSNTAVSLISDYTGAVITGQLPYAGWARYMVAEANMSSAATWSLIASGCTATIDSNGAWTITAVTGNGYLDITGTYNGLSITQRVTVIKTQTGTGGSNVVSLSNFTTVTALTYASNPFPVGTVKASAAGKLKFSAALNYDVGFANGPGSRNMIMAGKLAYRLAGSNSGWTDANAEVLGSEAYTYKSNSASEPEADSNSGYLVVDAFTTSSLNVSTDYEFGIFLRKVSGNATSTPYGNVSAEPVA